MEITPFEAEKVLGYGCLGLVYSVVSQNVHDRDKVYALKRFNMAKDITLGCALKEYNVLKKVTLDPKPSPFLPKLFYAFTIKVSPALVLNLGSSLTLHNLVEVNGSLTISQARFYISEIMCALKYLHHRNIVHMECKPDNILLSNLGHVILSDFDRSYDLTKNCPTNYDFLVATYYAAPEVASKKSITPKADVWSLGILMAELLGKKQRSGFGGRRLQLSRAVGGIWTYFKYSELQTNLKEFFNKVFTYAYVSRPSIPELQRIAFFKSTKWEELESLYVKPPFLGYELAKMSKKLERIFDPCNPSLLESLHHRAMPLVSKGRLQYEYNSNGDPCVKLEEPNIPQSDEAKLALINTLKDFNFIHPSLNCYRLLSDGRITDKYIEENTD